MAKKNVGKPKLSTSGTHRAGSPGSAVGTETTNESTGEIRETFQLTSVEQLRSVAIPLRINILRLLADKAMTTKQLAEVLSQPVTRLYHHMDALVGAGLVTIVQENAKRGTIERYFRAVARYFRAGQELLSGGSPRDARITLLVDLLEQSKTALLHLGSDRQANSVAGAGCSVNASPKEVKELMDLLVRTIKEWEAKCANRNNVTGESTACRIALCIHPEASNK